MNKFNLVKNNLLRPSREVKFTRVGGTLDDKINVKSTNSGNYQGCLWDFPFATFPELNDANNTLVFNFSLTSNKEQNLVLVNSYRKRDGGLIQDDLISNIHLEEGTTKDYNFLIPLKQVNGTTLGSVKPSLYNNTGDQVDFTIFNTSFSVLNGKNFENDLELKMNQQPLSNGVGVIKSEFDQGTEWLTATMPPKKQWQGIRWIFPIADIINYSSVHKMNDIRINFDMYSDYESPIKFAIIVHDVNGNTTRNDTLLATNVTNNGKRYHVTLPARYADGTKEVILAVYRDAAVNKETVLSVANIKVGNENTVVSPVVSGDSTSRLPIVKLTGDTSLMNKDTKVMLQFEFNDHGRVVTGYSKTKWQGDSSLKYPKKAYKIKLYEDEQGENKKKFVPFAGWKSDNEFNLKANYNEATFGRNVVNSGLFADISANRHALRKELVGADSFATVKGQPVLVYINDEFAGTYTFNTTKDVYMNMDKKNNDHIVVGGTQWNNATLFQKESALLDGTDFEIIQNAGDDEDTKTKFNRLVKFVYSSTDEDFKQHASEYIDVPSMIDWIAFVMMIQGSDSLGKNTTFATWDGNVWSATAYDLDTSWSMYFDGSKLVSPDEDLFDFKNNKLYQRIFNLFKDDFKERYAELRNTVMTASNILDKFTDWYYSVGEENYEVEKQLWNAPSFGVTSLAQLKSDIPLRLLAVDKQVSEK